jgi:hypothetical protein
MDPDTLLSITGLQYHWHGIYDIALSPDSTRWTATRLDTPSVTLTATSGTELRALIENDHAARKPRPTQQAESASL